MKKNIETSRAHEFDQEHFPCAKEWWCVIGFFSTVEDKKKWSFKVDLSQIKSKSNIIYSYYAITIFDIDNKKSFFYELDIKNFKLQTVENSIFIKGEKSCIKGTYPNYEMHFLDSNNKIDLDLIFNAESLPYWVAQQITNGWLPWGLGYYRYGFIPKNNFKGTICINNKKFSIIGKGYFEHVWGDFSFFNFSVSKVSIKKTISIYAKLFFNWIQSQNIKIPKSITFSTDNSPFGYDWVWALLDNGWNLFYGNMMSCISEGLATGILIFSKDGKKYNEFSNINFKYNKMKYLEKFDFYYPIELEITAIKDCEKLHLHIINICESIENILEESKEKSILGLVITQVPSRVEGYYFDGKEKINISGLSKIESHRLLRIFGHNILKINFELSKDLFCILSCLNSHYFGKRLDINLQFLPKPKLKINFNRIYRNSNGQYIV